MIRNHQQANGIPWYHNDAAVANDPSNNSICSNRTDIYQANVKNLKVAIFMTILGKEGPYHAQYLDKCFF